LSQSKVTRPVLSPFAELATGTAPFRLVLKSSDGRSISWPPLHRFHATSRLAGLAANCAQSACFCPGASTRDRKIHQYQASDQSLGGIKTAVLEYDCRNKRGA
jgi:hypothetical protein